MQVRLITAVAVASTLLTLGTVREARAYDYTAPVMFHPVASFDPANSDRAVSEQSPARGSTDLTLNIPAADPTDFGDPKVAMSALDGFSPDAPWSTTFNMPIDATSLAPAQTVRMFEVTLTGPGGGVTGIVRELASPQEFVVALAPSDTTGRTLAIVPTRRSARDLVHGRADERHQGRSAARRPARRCLICSPSARRRCAPAASRPFPRCRPRKRARSNRCAS